MSEVSYPYDVTGLASTNLISREPHVLTEINSLSKNTIIPTLAPFYQDNFLLEYRDTNGVYSPLVVGEDYDFSFLFIGATVSIGKKLYGGITIHREFLNGMIFATYQTLGGMWVADRTIVLENLASLIYNPRIASWEQITNVQEVFPALPHQQPLEQYKGLEDLIVKFDDIVNVLSMPPAESLQPQQVTLELLTSYDLLLNRLAALENDFATLSLGWEDPVSYAGLLQRLSDIESDLIILSGGSSNATVFNDVLNRLTAVENSSSTVNIELNGTVDVDGIKERLLLLETTLNSHLGVLDGTTNLDSLLARLIITENNVDILSQTVGDQTVINNINSRLTTIENNYITVNETLTYLSSITATVQFTSPGSAW